MCHKIEKRQLMRVTEFGSLARHNEAKSRDVSRDIFVSFLLKKYLGIKFASTLYFKDY
jgi:predicted nucleotidyltransferase